eukprot:gene7722-893_t
MQASFGQRLRTPAGSRGSMQPRQAFRNSRVVRVNASANGNGADTAEPAPSIYDGPTKPSAAETARTIAALCSEAIVSTINAGGRPIGSPVTWALDKAGGAFIKLTQMEIANLGKNPLCSVLLQPTAYPARAVASVTLSGKVDVSQSDGDMYKLDIESCQYLGGLDQSAQQEEVSSEEFLAAEPDTI